MIQCPECENSSRFNMAWVSSVVSQTGLLLNQYFSDATPQVSLMLPYTFTNLWGTINKPMIGVHANHPYPMKRTYPCNRSIPINFQVSPHHLLAILLTSHYSKICKLLYLGHCFVLVETICKYFNFFEVNRQCNEEKLIYLTYVKS